MTEEEPLERRLERVSRNLNEAAAELQGLVAILRERLRQEESELNRAYGRLMDCNGDGGHA